MFNLVKMQKLLDFEMYMGQMHYDGRMYCTCGSEEVMWSVLLSCGYNIFYIYPIAITCI